MKRYLLLLMIGICLMPGISVARAQGDALVIPAGQHMAGNVATIVQDIRVDGIVDGDVTSWNGAITITGRVGGDVVSYGGDVTVGATGRVDGHILASAGVLSQAPGAIVAGQKINGGAGEALASLLDLLNPGSGAGPDDVFGRALFGLALAVLLTAFCLLYTAFWPGRVALASNTLSHLPSRALALGIVTTLALALAFLPLAGLLVASVIGVPLLLLLLALALAIYVYGLVVLAHMLGIRSVAARAGGRLVGSTLVLVLLIAVVVALAPLWGLGLFFLLASPGLGAVVLSRGGMAQPVVAR